MNNQITILISAFLMLGCAASESPTSLLQPVSPDRKLPGGVDGGGGRSIVCRDADKNITSAMTLDLYEGEHSLGLNIPRSDKAVKDQVYEAISKIDQNNISVLKVKADHIFKEMRVLPDSSKLVPVDDSYELILPKDCLVEQLAHFVNPQQILVDGEIWSALPPTDQAALIVHEAVYWMERDFGATNSRRSREITAHIFDPNTKFAPIGDGVPKSASRCFAKKSVDAPGEKSFSMFWFYKKSKELYLQFETLGGQFVVSQKIFRAWDDKSIFDLTKSGEAIRGDENIGEEYTVVGGVTSKYEGQDVIQLTKKIEALRDYSTNRPIPNYSREVYYLSGKLFGGKGKDLDEYPINCSLEIGHEE